MRTTFRYSLLLAGISLIGGMLQMSPAQAQGTVNKKALEKATFYQAPREIQIIDESPLIRDFRTAPAPEGSVMLPPGPGAAPGVAPPSASGGRGAGALGNSPGGGSNPGDIQPGQSIPGGRGYRTVSPMVPRMGSLPQSGFGGSNIPAGGMGPKGLLPGITTGVVGKVMAQNKGVPAPVHPMTGTPKGMAVNPGRTVGNSNAPAAASYSGGYGTGTGNSYGGSASRTESMVRGSLLGKKH